MLKYALTLVLFTNLGYALMQSPALSQTHTFEAIEHWQDHDIQELGLALKESWTHGLNPDHYANPDALLSLPVGPERDRRARQAWFDYAEDLAFGRIDPRAIDDDWTAPVRDQDLQLWYERARGELGIINSLAQLAPKHPDYTALRVALISMTALSSAHILIEWGGVLSQGDRGVGVDRVRQRLFELGLLSDPGVSGAEFDDHMASAVMRFQARYNLTADGVVNLETLKELNTSNVERVAQIRVNLERWRWLPADLGERHIRVNLADYRLEAWSQGQVERVHETMIGKTYASTPIFSDEMSIIEINPWWLTPSGLGRQWVQTFRTRPGYAYSEGFRLVDLDSGRQVRASEADWNNGQYRVVQVPGPKNLMGKVKFLFPNRHHVYVHDTPDRHLFANSQRDDSSGCVRVRDPQALAIWVLEQEGWTAEAVRKFFAGQATERITLNQSIPIHILYFTVVTDQLGEVRFVYDVYDRDARLLKALNAEMPKSVQNKNQNYNTTERN